MKREVLYRVVRYTGGRPFNETGLMTWERACAELARLGPRCRIQTVTASRCSCGGWVMRGLLCATCSKLMARKVYRERQRKAA